VGSWIDVIEKFGGNVWEVESTKKKNTPALTSCCPSKLTGLENENKNHFKAIQCHNNGSKGDSSV